MTAIKEEYTFKKLLSVANYGSHNNSNQFSNLNLNRGHKCPSSDQSLSKSNNHKYSGGNVKNDYKEERKAWKNKSTKDSSVIKSKCSRLSTNEAVKETEDQKRWKNGKESKKLNSSSTLSLHIAAYENNIESFSKDDDNKNLQPKSKALKFVESLSNLHDSQDLLEFPRQMADDKSSTTPEVQQFAASQRLFSPNQDRIMSQEEDGQEVVAAEAAPAGDSNPDAKDGFERNLFDLNEWQDDETAINLIQRRVDKIPDLSRFTKLEYLSLRQNLLVQINENLAPLSALTELEISDNQLEVIEGLETLVNLQTLDLGYNRIKKIEGIDKLVNLERLYLVHNKISKIEGIQTLTKLKFLELGDNKIKQIENIDHLIDLEALYLGKNKIKKIENIENLKKLRVLSLPANRLIKLENLEPFLDLEELHVSDQGLTSLEGVSHLKKLTIIDASSNEIVSIDPVIGLDDLEDLWLNDNKVESWKEVEKLAKLPGLRTIYLERCPLQRKEGDQYRRKMILNLPQVTQIDAIMCR